MHIDLPQFYHFIDNLNIKNIERLDKNIAIIYRNYKKKNYIYNQRKKNFIFIGSAHNLNEIRINEKQGVQLIFLFSKERNIFQLPLT